MPECALHTIMLPVRGDQLLAESRSAGVGMLVMGAYLENCERESIFGGNNQVVGAEADLPAELVH